MASDVRNMMNDSVDEYQRNIRGALCIDLMNELFPEKTGPRPDLTPIIDVM